METKVTTVETEVTPATPAKVEIETKTHKFRTLNWLPPRTSIIYTLGKLQFWITLAATQITWPPEYAQYRTTALEVSAMLGVVAAQLGKSMAPMPEGVVAISTPKPPE